MLNGDGLAGRFPASDISGSHIICRECLIEGPVYASTQAKQDFFREQRRCFLSATYPEVNGYYFSTVVTEFIKLEEIPAGSEVNLWFENDLFCQTNMWYVIYLLRNRSTELKLFRIFPEVNNPGDKWKGFGTSENQDLINAFKKRVEFHRSDWELGSGLWKAYSDNESAKLINLSKSKSECFQYLSEVCEADVQRKSSDKNSGRPYQTLKQILSDGEREFEIIYSKFVNRDMIYGYGDLQVKRMLHEIIS